MRLVTTQFFLTIGLLALSTGISAAGCETARAYLQAQALRAQQRYAQAQDLLQQVVAADPSCMAARLELALVLFSLEDYVEARRLLQSLRMTLLQTEGMAETARATILRTIDSHLDYIEQLTEEQQASLANAAPLQAAATAEPTLQLALSSGTGDNINGGLKRDTLTFNLENTSITQPLAAQSKAQAGYFIDVETAYRAEPQQYAGMEGTLRVMTALRHNPKANEYDLGVLRGGLELQALNAQEHPLQPTAVLSAGSFILDGSPYRQDATLGFHLAPHLQERQVRISYQLTDSRYNTVQDSDARFHKVNVTLPLWEANREQTAVAVGLDVSHQWPESRERLSDYRENSLRLRGKLTSQSGHSLSASYTHSSQQDAQAYNPLAFGESKRDLRQTLWDVGWSYRLTPELTYEANLQQREAESAIPLFANDATELTVGLRWSLD